MQANYIRYVVSMKIAQLERSESGKVKSEKVKDKNCKASEGRRATDARSYVLKRKTAMLSLHSRKLIASANTISSTGLVGLIILAPEPSTADT